MKQKLRDCGCVPWEFPKDSKSEKVTNHYYEISTWTTYFVQNYLKTISLTLPKATAQLHAWPCRDINQVLNPSSQESCTPNGRDCYARIGKVESTCQVDCEGLYADVWIEYPINETIKDKAVLETLMQAYNDYKESHVKNLNLEETKGRFETVPVVYHPLQVVQIYFRTATYDEIVNDVSVSLGDQISAIGGTMGLFAGFSILSAVEVIYFILKFLFSLMSRRKNHI